MSMRDEIQFDVYVIQYVKKDLATELKILFYNY